MKTIVCTGDSHTWGQGDPSVIEYFGNQITGGDLRPVPFHLPCYVNIVRNEVNRITGSSAYDVDYRMFITEKFDPGIPCGLARFYFACQTEPAVCTINGKPFFIPASWGNNSYVTAAVFCERHIVLLPEGGVFLYRGEFYDGGYAVINSGVGSCTSVRYIQDYYTRYVSVFNPAFVIAEGHSINDWINRVPLHDTRRALKTILNHHRPDGCEGMLLTVSPVNGPTTEPYNTIDYYEYIKESRKAGEEAGAAVLDGYTAIGNGHYSDNWHPDSEGHKIYARLILDAFTGKI